MNINKVINKLLVLSISCGFFGIICFYFYNKDLDFFSTIAAALGMFISIYLMEEM